MLGKIKEITEVFDFKVKPVANQDGDEIRFKLIQALLERNEYFGFESMDGYKVVTDKHIIYVLIDNGQSCCESWGYFASNDDLSQFVGAELKEINLTDTALNKKKVEESNYYDDECGGIQFVDFVTDKGIFQLAVYNAHNGCYGHGILIAKDNDILLSETL